MVLRRKISKCIGIIPINKHYTALTKPERVTSLVLRKENSAIHKITKITDTFMAANDTKHTG